MNVDTEERMNNFFTLGLTLATLSCSLVARDVAAQGTSQTRPVDARVMRVKLDGLVDLRIRQGSTPSLVLSGDPQWIERTTTHQSGDLLSIGTEGHDLAERKDGLHAELTLPALREVASESLGSTEIVGFSGDQLELTLDGAGSMKVRCDYRLLTAKLGGIGSMNIDGLNGAGVDLRMGGAGHATVAGRGKWLKAKLGGLGGLDAQQFAAETVDLDLTGLGNATVNARRDANVNVSGMGSVTVFGKPLNRKVSVDGLGKVSWK
jgi:hypothetical protein